MASAIQKGIAAAQLAALALGTAGVPDDQVIDRAVAILIDFEPAERAEITAGAVAAGADPAVIQSFVNLVGGEVITVTGRAPRRGARWWWLLAALAAAGAGGYGIYRVRQRRRRLRA